MSDDAIERAARARKGTPFLNTEQAAAWLILTARRLQKMRKEGTGPEWRRHARFIHYHIDDLQSWSDEQKGKRP